MSNFFFSFRTRVIAQSGASKIFRSFHENGRRFSEVSVFLIFGATKEMREPLRVSVVEYSTRWIEEGEPQDPEAATRRGDLDKVVVGLDWIGFIGLDHRRSFYTSTQDEPLGYIT